MTQRESLIRQSVIDYIATFDGQAWAAVDIAGEAPMKYGVEEGVVVAVDSISVEPVDASSTTAEATAEIVISGYMRTDEYLRDYSDFVDWIHGDQFDPMIGVDFSSTIRFETEVELSPDGGEAWFDHERIEWVD